MVGCSLNIQLRLLQQNRFRGLDLDGLDRFVLPHRAFEPVFFWELKMRFNMKIPVYVRACRETARECVAIAEVGYNPQYVEAMLEDPVSNISAAEELTTRTRLAVIHKLSDGNSYAEEVVSSAEYVEAVNFWTKVFKLNVREHQPITGYCGWLTPRN
jgi:hypothetical protein